MSSDLKIQNMNHEKSTAHPLRHDFLPDPSACFRMLCIGSSHAGKTMCCLNIFSKKDFGLKQYYDDGRDIFVISPTINLDRAGWKMLDLSEHQIMSEYDESLIKEIMEYSRHKSKNGCLLICDDLVNNSKAFNAHKASLLDDLFMSGRHFRMSILILSQFCKSLTPKMRANATHLVVFRLGNVKERSSFLDDQADVPQIEERYSYCTDEKYSFIYINKVPNPVRVFKCFEEEV